MIDSSYYHTQVVTESHVNWRTMKSEMISIDEDSASQVPVGTEGLENSKDTSNLGYSHLKWIGGKGGLSFCFLNMQSDKAVICVI